MTNFYDYWLKLNKWNSEQAALLCNGRDPRIDKNRVTFPIENDDFSGVKPGTWQWETLEDYFVFEVDDWLIYVEDRPGLPKEASPLDFLYRAIHKGIKMPKEMRAMYDAHIESIPLRSTCFQIKNVRSRHKETTDKAEVQDFKVESNEDQSKASVNRVNQDETTGKYPWCQFARSKGKEILEQHPLFSKQQIANKVRHIMEEEGIAGRGGKVPSAETIRRHALAGLRT